MYDKLEIIERAILLNPRYIQVFREKLRITQLKLAKESGISQSHLSMLEKNKRKPTKLIAAAITYGLLKCYYERDKDIYKLLDTLSLLKFEDSLIEFIYDIIKNNNKKYIRYLGEKKYILLTKKSLIDELTNRIKVIELKNIEISRGKIIGYGKYFDEKDVNIVLDCSDIRRLEKKFMEKYNKKIIIQAFPKDEVPPIYNYNNNDCLIIHCW